jgi:uncharacterized Ntn-hydrolase superfamily protein
MRSLIGGIGFIVAIASGSSAFATYSIAAADMASQQVGGAVTSCVGSLDLASVYGSVPGSGVIHAQAQLDQRLRGKLRALELIGQGVAPSDIIAMITTSNVDAGFASRQYGVVDLQGRAAGYTGAQAQAYKKDQQGRIGSFAYSVQGNILTSQRVLDQAAKGFEAEACDLADRLMAALEAGGENGEGDSRCTRGGIPSDAAFIQVDQPGQPAGSWLKLSVSDTGPENPLPKLRVLFDTWRKANPCIRGGVAGMGGSTANGGISGGSAGISGAAAAASGTGANAGASAGMRGGGATAGVGSSAVAGAESSAGPRAANAGRAGGTSGAGTITSASTIAGAGGIAGAPVRANPAAIGGSNGASPASPIASHEGCTVRPAAREPHAIVTIVLLCVVAAYARSRRLRRGGNLRVRAQLPDHAVGRDC